MISSFDVYLIMQLDTIRGVASTCSIVLTGLGVIGCLVKAAADSEADNDSAKSLSVTLRIAPKILYCGLLCIPVYAFAPSTKTAAAMVILPAITSDQVTEPLSKEAKELFEIAKDALRNLSGKKPEKDGAA